MDYEIRQLALDQTSAFRQLLQVFGEAFHEAATYGDKQPSDAYLKRLLDSDTFIAVCAQSGGKVIGGLAAYVLEKFEQERKEIYIYDIAVLERFRRRGVATALIQKLKEIATEKGAYDIFVQADEGDAAAIKLYESLGVAEKVLHFDILISQ